MANWNSLFRHLVVALAISTVVAVGCGSDRTGGPRGEPQAVVDASPDRTLTAESAAFEASAPEAVRIGRVALDDTGEVTGESAARNTQQYPELVDPRSVVDLVRGALASESYGGAAVRGVSTFRYETVINVERAVAETPTAGRARMEQFARLLGSPAFYADVWIDADGRLRRVQVPVEKTTERPEARSKRLPTLVTIDFVDFEGPGVGSG